MLGELVPCSGGPPLPLRKPKLVVGRDGSCDIPLSLAMVSRRHCELELREGYWFVRDLDSSNGTRVNGSPCKAEWLLPKDVLSVAHCRYTIVYVAPTDKQPPRRSVAAESGNADPAKATQASAGRRVEVLLLKPAPEDTGEAGCQGQLIPCGGGDPIPLRKPTLLVGRDRGCDIVIRSKYVSGRHCQLEWSKGKWFVHDLRSQNGVRVDGIRCDEKALKHGSILAVANQRFRLVVGEGRGNVPGPAFTQNLLEAAGLVEWQEKLNAGEELNLEEDD